MRHPLPPGRSVVSPRVPYPPFPLSLRRRHCYYRSKGPSANCTMNCPGCHIFLRLDDGARGCHFLLVSLLRSGFGHTPLRFPTYVAMVRQGHPPPYFDARYPTNITSPAFTISCHAHASRATVVQSPVSPNNARFPSRRAYSHYFVPTVPPAGCLNSSRWGNWLPSKRTRNPSKRKAACGSTFPGSHTYS